MLYFPKFDNGISKTMAEVMLEPNDPVHGIDHTREVFNTCMNILHSRVDDDGRLYVDFNTWESEKPAPTLIVTQRIINIMVIATAFHDVCRGKDNHEIEGAKLFESYFSDISETVPGKKSVFTIVEKDLVYEIMLDKDDVEVVKCIIKSHRSSNGQTLHLINQPDMMCAILRDADKLDAIGVNGIRRCIIHGAMNGQPFHDPQLLPKNKYDGNSTTGVNHIFEKLLKINPESMYTKSASAMAERGHVSLVKFIEIIDKETIPTLFGIGTQNPYSVHITEPGKD